MRVLFLLASLSSFAAADPVDLRFEEAPARTPTKAELRRIQAEEARERAHLKKESDARREEMVKGMAPAMRGLIALMSKRTVEECGICGGVSIDADGVRCVRQEGFTSGVCPSPVCKGSYTVIKGSDYAAKGYKPVDGGLAVGQETLNLEQVSEAISYAQMARGVFPKRSRASAVASCR